VRQVSNAHLTKRLGGCLRFLGAVNGVEQALLGAAQLRAGRDGARRRRGCLVAQAAAHVLVVRAVALRGGSDASSMSRHTLYWVTWRAPVHHVASETCSGQKLTGTACHTVWWVTWLAAVYYVVRHTQPRYVSYDASQVSSGVVPGTQRPQSSRTGNDCKAPVPTSASATAVRSSRMRSALTAASSVAAAAAAAAFASK
jgi:hypothetical protein